MKRMAALLLALLATQARAQIRAEFAGYPEANPSSIRVAVNNHDAGALPLFKNLTLKFFALHGASIIGVTAGADAAGATFTLSQSGDTTLLHGTFPAFPVPSCAGGRHGLPDFCHILTSGTGSVEAAGPQYAGAALGAKAMYDITACETPSTFDDLPALNAVGVIVSQSPGRVELPYSLPAITGPGQTIEVPVYIHGWNNPDQAGAVEEWTEMAFSPGLVPTAVTAGTGAWLPSVCGAGGYSDGILQVFTCTIDACATALNGTLFTITSHVGDSWQGEPLTVTLTHSAKSLRPVVPMVQTCVQGMPRLGALVYGNASVTAQAASGGGGDGGPPHIDPAPSHPAIGPASYYDILGRKISKPTGRGVYFVRRQGEATKRIVVVR